MSLFEDNRYQYRETYFVLFQALSRPDPDSIVTLIKNLGKRYEVGQLRTDEDGGFESLTVYSPTDFSALDITLVIGDEVRDHVVELQEEMSALPLDPEEKGKLNLVTDCDARFDIFHFELTGDGAEGGEEFLDPGALIVILEQLAAVCDGVAVDPQSGTLM